MVSRILLFSIFHAEIEEHDIFVLFSEIWALELEWLGGVW